MANYNKILIFVLVIAVFVSMMAISASATEIDTIEETVVDTITEESTITEDETVTDSSADLAETNEYLRYITGFLLFFVIVLLFHYAYKFFNLFF